MIVVVQLGLPTPVLATVVSMFMELPVAFAVAVGAFTRPSAALLALYALDCAYWPSILDSERGGLR
jgi:putative oxidoreductase